MNAAVSIVLLAAVLGVIVFLLSRRENNRRSQYGPSITRGTKSGSSSMVAFISS